MDPMEKERFSKQKREQLSRDIYRILADYYAAKKQHSAGEKTLVMELQMTAYEIIGFQYYAVVHTSDTRLISKDDFIQDCLISVSDQFKKGACTLHENSNIFGYIVGVMKNVLKEYHRKNKLAKERFQSMEVSDSDEKEISLLDIKQTENDYQRLSVLFEGLWDDLAHSIAKNEKELEYMKIAILNGLILENYTQKEVAEIFHISESAVSQKNKKLLNALRVKMKHLGFASNQQGDMGKREGVENGS